MANRSTVNRLRGSMKLRALMATRAVLFLAAVCALAFLFIPAMAHGQNVKASAFVGAGRGDIGTILTAAKATTANGGGCNVDVNVTCVIEVGADLSIYADGTLPTLDSRTMVIDYRSAAGVRVIVGGTSSLVALGGSFTGGTITSPILAADGTTAAPSYSFSGEAGLGIRRSASGNISLVSTGADRLTVNSSGTVLAGNAILSFNARGQWSSPALDIIEQVRSTNNQKYRVYGTTAGPNYLEMSSESVCGVSTANTGKLCFQYSDNTLKVSTNGGATATIPSAASSQSFVMASGCAGALTASSNTPMPMYGSGTTSFTCTAVAETAATEMPVPKASTLTGIASIVANSGTTTGTAAIFKNGVSAMTCTMGSGVTTCNGSGSVSFALGDTVGLVYTSGAATTQTSPRISAFFTVP